VISVEDWAEIRRLHRAEEMSIRAIARHLSISKNTVKRALGSDRAPVYQRPVRYQKSRTSLTWVFARLS
jgi:transposase